MNPTLAHFAGQWQRPQGAILAGQADSDDLPREPGEDDGAYRLRLHRWAVWKAMAAPSTRGFASACRAAIDGRDLAGLDRWIGPDPWAPANPRHAVPLLDDPAFFQFGRQAALRPVFLASLLCVRAAVASTSWLDDGQIPESEVREIAAECSLPACVVRDIAHDLLNRPLPAMGEAQPTIVLLISRGDGRGVAADLTMEVVPEGDGTTFPAPDLNLIDFDDKFRESFQAAEGVARREIGPIPPSLGVRWGLTPRKRETLPVAVTGPSASSGFGALLGKTIQAMARA